MSLKEYRRKRKFAQTPEPRGGRAKGKGPLRFVVHKHAATRTHFDLRLEVDGAFKSWAVPKGPSLLAHDPRLAVRVEDHPLEYGEFEGVIPKGNYGAGTVMIWDQGTYEERGSSDRAESEKAMRSGLAEGHVTILLEGQKLRGEFALVKLKKKGADENAWLLIKKSDAAATRREPVDDDRSVASGRTMAQIAAQAPKKGEVWVPGKGRAKGPRPVTARAASARPAPPPASPPARAAAARPARPPAPAAREPKAARSPIPHRLRPMEPVAAAAPSGKGWIYEHPAGGVRAIAHAEPGKVSLRSRAHLPFERKFPGIVTALRKLRHTVVLDGEIVGSATEATFVVSDLLYLDGRDLRDVPLRERKRKLADLALGEPLARGEWSEKVPAGNGPFVAKRAESLYRSGLSRDWLRFRPSAARASRETDRPPLTHPTKVFWPDEGYTKGDLARYYDAISDTILPYLVDRPQSLHRQPDGIRDEGFFHKDMASFLPRRIETERIVSGSSGKTINYVLCQDRWALLYLVNLGCIELNPWLSRRGSLDRPDFVVIDIDPDDNPFSDVVRVAREVHAVLRAAGAEAWCKTSGASGLHVCIPTGGRCDYDTSRTFAEAVCRVVHAKLPKLTSVERNPAKRRHRIYLDFLQNRRGQTLAAPYCVRPRPGATVSAPLAWTEVKEGLDPRKFTLRTMAARLRRTGDLWKPLLTERVDIEKAMKELSRRFHTVFD